MRFQLTKVSWTLQRNFTISYWRRDNKILSICKGFGPQLWNIILWEISVWIEPLKKCTSTRNFLFPLLVFPPADFFLYQYNRCHSYLALLAVSICKIQDTGLENSNQQNGPDIIDTCYLLSIKKGDGLAVVFIPYSLTEFLSFSITSISFFHAKVFWLLDPIF